MSAAPKSAAGEFIDTAAALARQLSPAAQAALEKTWPAEAPHPAVVAHLLAVMLVDVHAEVSKGFIRARHQEPRLPAKPPAPHAS